MLTKLYIGTECIEIQEKVNLQYFLSDWRSFNSGGNNSSFTFSAPLNKLNGFILKNPQIPGSKEFVTGKASLFINGLLMLRGKLIVLNSDRDIAEIKLDGKDWMDGLSQNKLTDLDLASENYTLTQANMEASWAGSDKFYRYPFINFGALAKGGTIASADWCVIDFGPWFRIKNIVAKIFAEYTIVSDFFDSTFGKNIYMSAKRVIANADFLNDKEFEANINSDADNKDFAEIASLATDTVTVDKTTYATRTDINTEISDEGANWATDEYTVPETGTYRFRSSFKVECTWTQFPLLAGQIKLRIYKRTSTTDTLLTSNDDAGAIDAADWNKVYTMDTDYVHLVAGDKVWVYCYLTATDSNGTGSPETLSVFLTGGASYKFWNEVDNWCLFEGINKTIVIADNLPDITQLQFLQGLKHAFNLRFFFDSVNSKLYIDPADTFMTTAEYDLTPYVRGQAKIFNFITDYTQKMWLRWKDDPGDQLHVDYGAVNKTPPKYKAIAHTNSYMKDGIDIVPNPVFSVCIDAEHGAHGSLGEVASIFKLFDRTLSVMYPSEPPVSFVTRIGEWEGLTACANWNLNGVVQTSYPRMDSIDMATMFTNYFAKTIHYINTGKMCECNIQATPQFINSLITEIGSILTLGWKVKYKLDINGTPYLFYLSRVVTDGETAKLELILTQ